MCVCVCTNLCPVKRATWLSHFVVIPKKNGKICVCVDYYKLNAATVTNGFPLLFILDTVADHECFNFLDGFNGDPENQEKTTFVMEWGVVVAEIMMFGLKMTSTTFQRIITEIFDEYILALMHVFLYEFVVYGQWLELMT